MYKSFKQSLAFLAAAVVLSCFVGCADENGTDGEKPGKAISLDKTIEGKTFFSKEDNADNFYLSLYCGAVEIFTSESGSAWIPSDENSKLLYLDLYAASAENSQNPTLPAGTYTIAANQNPGSAYDKYTYGLWYFDNKIDYVDSKSGTVTVTHTAKGYKIVAEFEMARSSTGEVIGKQKFSYEGPLTFTSMEGPDPDPGADFPLITEPVNTTFLGADIKYLGIPAYSSPVDVYVIDLYDDPTPLENGALDEGNILRLELYTEHQGYFPGEKKLKMPAGTYTMTDGHVPVAVGIGTGNLWDSGYGHFPYGSYIRHLDEATETVLYGFLGETGNVKVEVTEAGVYTITVDLVTRQNVAIKGTYTGSVVIVNEAQEPERQTQSRIYEDKVLNLSNTTSAEVTFGGKSKNPSTNFYHIFAQDPVSRQGFQLQLLAPVGEIGRVAGTYTPAEVLIPLKMQPFTYIPGDIQLVTGGAAMIGTWGYYEENAAGKAVAFAPALTGNIIVKEAQKNGATVYTIEYVLTDDNFDEPHTMTAKFEGAFDIEDKSTPSAASAALRQVTANKKVPQQKAVSRRLASQSSQKALRN